MRKDLRRSQQAVQAGHAVAEFMLRFPDSEWKNNYLIYLGVEDKSELEKWWYKTKEYGIQCAVFKEPDINNELTAIAAAVDNGMFKKLKLL